MDFFTRKDYQRVVLYIVTSVSVLLALKYLLPYFLPLLFSLLLVVPIQHFYLKREASVKKRLRHNKGFMAGGILFGIILLVALILVGAGTFIMSKARNMVQEIDFLTANISNIINSFCERIEKFFGLESGILELWIKNRIDGFGGTLTDTSDRLIADSIKYMAVAGQFFTLIIVTFICVVLFAREIEDWQQGILNIAVLEPAIDRILSIIIRIGKKLGAMIKAYLKTQGIILICISITATAGLYLGGMQEAYFYGIFAGLMDVLPFIGTGIVLIPIGVVNLISGKIGGGITVIITYLTCVMIRELLEPRLLGNGMKFSPMAILISVYAGVKFYGLGGVVLGPITLLILVELGREIFVPKQHRPR